MKANVNKDACIGCGACTAVCPNVFDFSDEGYAKVIVEEIKEEDKSAANDAKDGCPTSAISISE